MSALSKYGDALVNYPARGTGLHQHAMRVACLGTIAEIPPQTIVADMQAFDGIKRGEAEEAVSKASGMQFESSEYTAPIKAKPRNTLDDFIKGVSSAEVDLLESSPIILGDVANDAHVLLNALYSPDEVLFIGDVYTSEVRTVREWLDTDITKFPHIIPNPMSGEQGVTGSGTMSFRCDNTVADARYAVCEMDEAPLPKQVAFWIECIRIGIPVSAVIHSGKKSLHGWVKVNCGTDRKKWDELVRQWWFKDFGASYGFDPACQNPARLSRLAGHKRDTGMQRLLYLNGEV